MTSIKDLKIYLIDINPEMCNAWSKIILKHSDEHPELSRVEIYEGSLYNFCNHYSPYVDAWVSPANSYGLMDGGYDKALTDQFGVDIQNKIQKIITDKYYGEQPVGTAISTFFPYGYLIHTPSMRVPSIIFDHDVVYTCTRSCIMEALKRECISILIPAFGAGTGKVPYDVVAEKMIAAILQLNNPEDISWQYARWSHPLRFV